MDEAYVRCMTAHRLVLAALVLVVAVQAAPASAGTIVWSKGGDLWAMQEDGSAPHLLIPKSAAPGMTTLQNPGVHPAGTTVTFEGSTTANQVSRLGLCGAFPWQYSCTTFHFGFNATGVYRWTGGNTVERLTGDPAYCFNCTASSVAPEPRGDGAVDYGFQHCQGFLDDGSYTCVGAVKSTSGEPYPSCTDLPDEPSPNPVSPSQLVYSGCTSAGHDALVVTGPDRAGEHVVGCDDAEQADPSWSPAGDAVVAAEGGTDPGIWVYGASNTACFAGSLRHAVVAPSGVTFSSPRMTGSRIIFEAQGEVWSVPATCTTCAFPAAATQLTTGGDNKDPAWTAAALSTPAFGGAGPAPGAGTTPGSGTSGTGADITAPTLQVTVATRQRILRQRKSILLKIRSSEVATLTITGAISLPGTDPKLKSVKRTLAAGRTVTVRIVLSAKAVRAVRRAWARGRKVVAVLKVTLRDPAGNTRKATKRITLRR